MKRFIPVFLFNKKNNDGLFPNSALSLIADKIIINKYNFLRSTTMVKQDLIDFSPVRYFDNATNGGLKDGEMGIITAKKGLGQTSVLVQFGLDALIHDKHVIHVSFDQHSSNVISWYDSILAEIGKKKNIDNIGALSDAIVSNRTILNFNQENFTLPKVINTIKAMKDGGINIASLIIDGADMSKVSEADVKAVADFVKAEKMTAWFSSTNESDKLKDSLDNALLPMFSTVAHIGAAQNVVSLAVLKCEGKEVSDINVKLDSKTLLMAK